MIPALIRNRPVMLFFTVVLWIVINSANTAQGQFGRESVNSDARYRIINFGFIARIRDRLDLIVERDKPSPMSGYRVIRFRLQYQSSNPQPNDESFKIVAIDYRRDLSQTVVQNVTIPAGSTYVDSQISVRAAQNMAKIIQWAVVELDGAIPNVVQRGVAAARGQSFIPGKPTTLLIDQNAPDFHLRYQNWLNLNPATKLNLNPATKTGPISASYQYPSILISNPDSAKAILGSTRTFPLNGIIGNPTVRHPTEISNVWRDLTCYEKIVLSYETLDDWKVNEPGKCESLRNWIATGGKLIVFGEQQSPEDQWKENDFCQSLGEKLTSKAKVPVKYGLEPTLLYSRRTLGMGSAIPIEDFAKDSSNGQHARSQNRLGLSSTLGVSINKLGNDSSAGRLVIPGIGEPPINTFRILITLFFAIVGPLNYFLLRYIKRLHLILFTLPAFALIACISLILYSLIADGFTTRGRVISISHIDQNAGQLVSFSQQAYYSPLVGGGSIQCADDTAIFPVLFKQMASPFVTHVKEGSQTISGGNMKTRTMNQFAVVRSAPSDAKLVIDYSGSAIKFQNQLKGNLQCVVFCDEKSVLHYGEKTLVGAENQTTVISSGKQLADKFKKYFDSARVELPENIREAYAKPVPVMDEAGIAYYANQSMIQLAFQPQTLLKPNTYFAIVETSAEIPLLRPNAGFESSLNVIVGTWSND